MCKQHTLLFCALEASLQHEDPELQDGTCEGIYDGCFLTKFCAPFFENIPLLPVCASQPGSQGEPWPDADPWHGQGSQLSVASTQGVDPLA